MSDSLLSAHAMNIELAVVQCATPTMRLRTALIGTPFEQDPDRLGAIIKLVGLLGCQVREGKQSVTEANAAAQAKVASAHSNAANQLAQVQGQRQNESRLLSLAMSAHPEDKTPLGAAECINRLTMERNEARAELSKRLIAAGDDAPPDADAPFVFAAMGACALVSPDNRRKIAYLRRRGWGQAQDGWRDNAGGGGVLYISQAVEEQARRDAEVVKPALEGKATSPAMIGEMQIHAHGEAARSEYFKTGQADLLRAVAVPGEVEIIAPAKADQTMVEAMDEVFADASPAEAAQDATPAVDPDPPIPVLDDEPEPLAPRAAAVAPLQWDHDPQEAIYFAASSKHVGNGRAMILIKRRGNGTYHLSSPDPQMNVELTGATAGIEGAQHPVESLAKAQKIAEMVNADIANRAALDSQERARDSGEPVVQRAAPIPVGYDPAEDAPAQIPVNRRDPLAPAPVYDDGPHGEEFVKLKMAGKI